MDERQGNDDQRKPIRFVELLRSLVEHKVEFVVVGGVAAVLEGAPVSTFDLDIVYSGTEENIQHLTQALTDLDAIYLDPAGRRIRPDADRLRPGGHHLLRTRFGRLDVLATIGSNLGYRELDGHSSERVIHGMTVSVLNLETLIETKQTANRPKDRAVLDLLRETLAQRGQGNES